ncbi:MAG: hypothetical protein WBJ42_01015 [Thermovirgaceae bacterium]|nr:hypothetical protein [Synergistales bacterium]
MAKKWIHRDLTTEVKDILTHAEAYHAYYYESERFTGPSLHFHCRAIEVQQSNWLDALELAYAALASWGMHRMGTTGSKMQSYEKFNSTIRSVQEEIEKLRQKAPHELTPSDWSSLEKVFKTIDVMESGTKLIGNSKAMAHILPRLVAPIDREYTLNYLFGNNMFQNNLEQEWGLMHKILSDFYYPVASDGSFQRLTKRWMADKNCPWDTSVLKIIDNLVIGAERTHRDGVR